MDEKGVCEGPVPPAAGGRRRSTGVRWVALLLALAFCLPASAADEPANTSPAEGAAAPAFRLQDQHGAWHTLDQYRGRFVVLYFYPKDFTPGCTTQVCAFRDDIVALRKAGAEVLGVSLDDVKSHAEFAAKHGVPFPLLSDATQSVAKSYGVLTSRAGFAYARRDTFLIDPQGRVARHYENVDPKQNVKNVLSDLDALRSAAP
jgi:peroxiredoxin Q/BCP